MSPAIGAGIIPVLGYIFPFEEKDKNSPPSVVGGAGLITDNGSRGFGVGGDVFLKKDRYELRSFYAHGNINYDLYGVGYLNGNSSVKLPLKQAGQIFFVEFLRDIHWKIFVGPRFVNGDSFITVSTTNGPASKIPPDVGLTTNLRAVGFRVVRDSRIIRFYSTQGMLVDFSADFFSQGLGSKYSFQSYKFTFNKYWSIAQKQVLAYKLFLCGTGGHFLPAGGTAFASCSANNTTSICAPILREARIPLLGVWGSPKHFKLRMVHPTCSPGFTARSSEKRFSAIFPHQPLCQVLRIRRKG